MAALPRTFYARQAPLVARDLVGKILVKRPDPQEAGGRPDPPLRARIVETEAYGGPEDLASHARFGPTARNASMFGPPGRAYVYFVYGMHHCLNVVTGSKDEGQAVLLRAAEPLDGWDIDLSGPGRLARGFGVTREHDGADLVRGSLRILDSDRKERGEGAVVASRRVGVEYAGPWAHEPLRFLDAASEHVSRPAAFQSPARSRRRGRKTV